MYVWPNKLQRSWHWFNAKHRMWLKCEFSMYCIRDTGDRDDESRVTWTESQSSVSLLSRSRLVSKDIIYFTTLFIKSMVRRTVVGWTPATIIESRRNHIVLSDGRASSVRNPSTTFSHVTSNIQSCSNYKSSVSPRGSVILSEIRLQVISATDQRQCTVCS